MPATTHARRRPDWIRTRILETPEFKEVKRLTRGLGLATVCEEARCPNIYECWHHRTATFMLFGDRCTRDCRFCSVRHGRPLPLDPLEPDHVAEAVARLGLEHVVLTSVTRDDLEDGGAEHFARVIARVRAVRAQVRVEVLIPDFRGDARALETVMDAGPDVLGHNVETVPRLYRQVRPSADYRRSLDLLRAAASHRTGDYPLLTKSGIICGLGESAEELEAVMDDLRAHDVDILTVGQYLQPSREQLPVARYYRPEEFERLRAAGLEKGFKHVEAGPLVRSSYHAHEQILALV